MDEDRIGLGKCLPRQKDKCRERHVQAAINAPPTSYLEFTTPECSLDNLLKC